MVKHVIMLPIGNNIESDHHLDCNLDHFAPCKWGIRSKQIPGKAQSAHLDNKMNINVSTNVNVLFCQEFISL